MTPTIIPNRPFDHPAAWTAADLGGKDAFAFDLDDRHIAAFESAVSRLRERGLTAFEGIGRRDFPLDTIAEDVRAWCHEVSDGRGLLLLRGFPVDRWSQEDTELVWFGLGTHFGRAVSQSVLGDLLGHVVNVGGDDMRHRAYRNARELRMHTDRCDTVGMFCLRRAKSGGESGYSSALAVHDRIRELKPELLEIDLERLPPAPLRRAAARRASLHPDPHPGVLRARRRAHGDPDWRLRVDGGRRVRCAVQRPRPRGAGHLRAPGRRPRVQNQLPARTRGGGPVQQLARCCTTAPRSRTTTSRT